MTAWILARIVTEIIMGTRIQTCASSVIFASCLFPQFSKPIYLVLTGRVVHILVTTIHGVFIHSYHVHTHGSATR